MKILKEAKEDLPVSFLTNLVSKGWDEVGILKEQMRAIKEEFKGTKKVEELLQGLIDAYLVCIGQTELLMKDKSYIEMPDEEKEDKKDLSEDLLLKVTPLVDVDPIVDLNKAEEVSACTTCAPQEEIAIEEMPCETECEHCDCSEEPTIEIEGSEPFDYFCDFDEPDLTVAKVTDADLYPQRDPQKAI